MWDDMLNEWKNVASYATKENLVKKLEKCGLTQYKSLYVLTPEGRHTAVFLMSFLPKDINFMYIVHCGFKIVS